MQKEKSVCRGSFFTLQVGGDSVVGRRGKKYY